MATQPVRPLAQLSAEGVSVWLDDLSRDRIRTGDLQRLIDTSSVVGVTTNPTIFANALASGESYADQIAELQAAGYGDTDVEGAAFEIMTRDVADAADLLAPVARRTRGEDGRVSIEVDPTLARDAPATVAMARDLWKKVAKDNIHVKIPATVEGLAAITDAIAEGISVNVTVLFGIDRYRAVAEAYLQGLERAADAGRDLSAIHSVASIFVSRIESEVDDRLTAIGTPAALELRGHVAVAVSRSAYAAYQEIFAGQRWEALAARGAHRQRVLWASTGTRNAEYSDTKYVAGLVAPGTVSTMTEDTLLAFGGHGQVEGPFPDASSDFAAEARRVLSRLAEAGVDYADAADALETAALQRFEDSWSQLLGSVRAALV